MSRHRWLLAARPATLWAGVAPVIVGTGTAVDDDVFSWDVFAGALAVAIAIQVGVNFANDLSDAARGADDADRIGPARAVASGLISPAKMRQGIAAAFAVAAIAGLYLAVRSSLVIVVVGAVSFAAALGYTGGPKPYGYRGLGELFVFVFFGLVATVGTRFVYDESMPAAAWIGSVVMGLLASAILVANNVRDIEGDRRVGKRTLAVILGRRRARALYAALVGGAFLTVVVAVATGVLPVTALLALIAVPLAVPPARAVLTSTAGPDLIVGLQGTARLQIVVAVLLAAGLVV